MPWDGLHSRLSGLTEVKMIKRGNRHRVQTPQAGESPCHENRRGDWDHSLTERCDGKSLAAWLLHAEKMTMVREWDSWSRSATLD